MFHRRTITKRVLAACGVLLTLVSCAQQSHALCGLVSCRIEAGDDAQGKASTKCCHQAKPSHVCSKSRDAGSRPPEGPTFAKQPAPSCPACPPNCVCCSLPIPQQPPSPVDTELASQPLAAQGIAAFSAATLSDVPSIELAAACGASPQRALDTCVRLCRFLS